MPESPDVESLKLTFARVEAYRHVCEAVKASAGQTLFSGVLFLGLTAFFMSGGNAKFFPIYIAYGVIGVGEILVGLWKKFFPSAEGVLADGLLQLAFAIAVGIRQLLVVQLGGGPSVISLVIAGWCLIDALRSFKAYVGLRRAFVQRPTSEQMAYVNDFVIEILESDPNDDPHALDIRTHPRFKARLLGDVAVFVETKSESVFVMSRDDVRIEREDRVGRTPKGYLTLEGEDYPGFELEPITWTNYARWKTEGGDPPPPIEVRPTAQGRRSDD